MREEPEVAIVILNWNGRDDTLACIASVRRSSYRNLRIVVADNGSTDGSQDALRALSDVDLVEAGRNLGAARGNNVGIRRALQGTCDYVALMNNDVVIHEDMIARLVEAAEADPRVGVAAPKMYYHEPADLLWCAGGTIHRWRGKSNHIGFMERDVGQHDRTAEIDYAGAAAVLVRRAVYERIGGEDPAYFIYYHDADFSMRTWAAGWSVVYVPEAVLWHKVSTSLGDESGAFWLHQNRGRMIFVRKLAARRHRAASYAYVALVDVPLALARFAWRRQLDRVLPYLRGLRAGLSAPLAVSLGAAEVGTERVAPALSPRPAEAPVRSRGMSPGGPSGRAEATLRLLRSEPKPMTAGAVSVLVGQGATGLLGEDPDPDVARALEELGRRGDAAMIGACPTCGLPGDLWTVPANAPEEGLRPSPPGAAEAAEALAPLIEEGSIEVGERAELVESDCCLRSARPWRPTPPPG